MNSATLELREDCLTGISYTVKKAVELLDVPSRNSFLVSNKYNSTVEILYS
jgi:hypothetical protein